jgi:tRNA U34 5-methylaminomethyl-2-thiouridine-forming methyltransferase MnmC
MQIKTTNDGSKTLFVPELNEHYHSIHGAYNEAVHVFINAGLAFLNKENYKVFEVGFGTGLNTWLSADYANSNKVSIDYYGIEKYPVDLSIAKQMEYTDNDISKQLFDHIHELPWEEKGSISDHFTLTKYQADLDVFTIPKELDLVYFDAFAPEKQENMWTKEIFSKLYDSLCSGGVLVTYCAKGVIRRRMQFIGFEVSRIPGPPGKREMLRAIKP